MIHRIGQDGQASHHLPLRSLMAGMALAIGVSTGEAGTVTGMRPVGYGNNGRTLWCGWDSVDNNAVYAYNHYCFSNVIVCGCVSGLHHSLRWWINCEGLPNICNCTYMVCVTMIPALMQCIVLSQAPQQGREQYIQQEFRSAVDVVMMMMDDGWVHYASALVYKSCV